MTLSVKNGRYISLIRLDLMFSMSWWKEFQLLEILNKLSIKHNKNKINQFYMKMMQNSWNLREKLEDIDLRGSDSIFINLGLCPYYRMHSSEGKRLLDLGKLINFMFLVVKSK